MSPPALQALLSLFLAASSTVVSAAVCGPGHYNASGSVNVPFPRPPASSPSDPSGNYTLSTELSFPGPLGFSQAFRATSASGHGIFEESLNYEGCFMVLGGSWPATQGHINEADQSSCQSAFSSGCISNIISNARSTATAFSQQHRLAGFNCGDFTPPNCANAADAFSSGKYTAASEFRGDRNLDANVLSFVSRHFHHGRRLAIHWLP